METKTPHLIIKEGPETGREIVIPANGARIGRAEENDITISDAAMSRFQCRMYFSDGFLHIMDLGSTNESLVNNQPVSDVALRFGDEVLIGESLLKVLSDGLHEPSQPHPDQTGAANASAAASAGMVETEPEPAPIIFNMGDTPPSPAPVPEPLSASVENVDLGLGRREDLEETKAKEERASGISLLLVALVTLIVLIVGGLIILRTSPPPVTVITEEEPTLQVHYEKVIAGDGNIFRYALDLNKDGQARAEVHDLQEEQSVTREAALPPESIEGLLKQLSINKDSFLALQGEYEGLPVGEHESYRITVILGKDSKTVRVANQVEPDAFSQVREKIEAYANNEMGLNNIYIPPEILRSRAQNSWENAQKLYRERDVKDGNLYEATLKLKDVIFLVETIEPKPEYFEDAIRLRKEWMDILEDRVMNLEFEAVRQYNLKDIGRARELNRRITLILPDKSHTQYQEAVNRLNQMNQER